MEYQRADRVGDLLAELISELLRREIRDPRIHAVTVTGVKVSKDLRHARIYFNLLGRPQDRGDASEALKRATGFIRSKVAKQLKLRFVPTLEFCYDESEDEAQRIDNLLKQVKS
jgi:ribosome-binding factor A